MADFNYDDYNPGFDGASSPGLAFKARRWVNIAGAVCSVSLVLGLGLWGYKLAMRDVTGVPVMRAAAGAMRIAPVDPGGEQALNQGLTVNAIAAVGTAAAPADQITLAPDPVALEDGDVPVVAAAMATPPADQVLSVSGSTDGDLAAVVPADPEATDEADAEIITIATDDPDAVRTSLRPLPRPVAAAGETSAGTTKAAPIKVQNVSSNAAAAEIDPATIPLGTRLAQLGPFESPDLARARFAELQSSLGELMAGKAMVIEAAQSGGRTFYRLRAHGFENDEDVRRFCSALLAEEADCIPVAQR